MSGTSIIAQIYISLMQHYYECKFIQNRSLMASQPYIYDIKIVSLIRNPVHKTYPLSKIESEYDQERPKSQTADKPMTPRG